ncbi:MAG: FUSC family membrane protein [Caldimonas sp.]
MRFAAALKFWLRLPAHAINGIEVALGIALIQLLSDGLAGAHVASLVVSGAVCASIADVPNTVVRTGHRVGAAAVLSAAAALTVDLLRPYSIALGIAVAAVAFVAMMTLAWGPRAGAVSFTPILSMVFSMAVPASPHPFETAGWSACGGVLYLGWSLLAGMACQRRYRSLVLAQTLATAANLFRSRADYLASARRGDTGNEPPLRAWIGGEAALADRLQAARDLLFAADESPRWRRDVAILLRVVDLRDVLLASRLDAELLGDDPTGRGMLDRLATALRAIGDRLDQAAALVRFGRSKGVGAPPRLDFDAALADVPMSPADVRARLVPSLIGRLRQLAADVGRVHRLLQGHEEALPLTRVQLQSFVTPEGWPLRALRPHWRRDSLVLRHAVRMGLALGTAYYLALMLPWGSHPYWLVLSVAVVLRGNLGETLARRNARVVGTVVGCLLVVVLSRVATAGALSGVFLVALGTAHAYVLQRYWLTATAASVMALLQSHLVNPAGGFAIAERVADTFLGALLAWCFSYVLPSWERRNVSEAIARVLRDLHDYATLSLNRISTDPVLERLARRKAYDSLAALAAALQRSSVEPRGVRLPTRQIATLLDHGERLMAHLSMVRLTLARLKDEQATPEQVDAALVEARAALTARLDLAVTFSATAATEGTGLLDLLPERPAAHDVLPWLSRRLSLMVHEAGLIRTSAMLTPAAA